jgi:(1->4)-alpha-D-glucan 1-alpha-D-glucosylmutase
MLYQSLLGAWPLEGEDGDFLQRMQAYAVKAAREGKQQTSWLAPNEGYERGLENFLARILDRSASAAFLESFEAFARRAALMGALNSLTQLALKAAMPGVPDFYQGTEQWDLSLVDPDNRRPVDFGTRAAALHAIGDAPSWPALAQSWQDGRIKFALMRRLLEVRAQFGELFAHGSYRALDVTGPHKDEIIAFARMHARDATIVVAGRLFRRATREGVEWPSGQAWEASVCIKGFSDAVAIIPGRTDVNGPRPAVSQLFGALPLAVLRANIASAKIRWSARKRSRKRLSG